MAYRVIQWATGPVGIHAVIDMRGVSLPPASFIDATSTNDRDRGSISGTMRSSPVLTV